MALKPAPTPAAAKGAAKTSGQPATPPEKIEVSVLAIPELDATQSPPLLDSFCLKLIPRIRLAPTSREILAAFSSPDVKAEKIAQFLKRNPYYQFQLLKHLQSMGKRSDVPSVDGAIVLLGMQNTRNFILALQLQRTVMGGHVPWSKEGKLGVNPPDVIKFALKTEEALGAGKKGTNSESAFAAGMLFDIMAHLVEKEAEDKKAAMNFVDIVYAHSLKTAQIGSAIAKILPDFTYAKLIAPACLLHDIGKLCLAILDGKYLKFLDDCANKETPRAVRLFAEEKKFGIHHAELGAMVCQAYGAFKTIDRAVLYHHNPFLALRQKSLYQLSAVVCLATNIANNLKRTEKADDPVLALWKPVELKDLRVDMGAVMSAVGKLS